MSEAEYRLELVKEAATAGYLKRSDFFEWASRLANAGRHGAAAEALSMAMGH